MSLQNAAAKAERNMMEAQTKASDIKTKEEQIRKNIKETKEQLDKAQEEGINRLQEQLVKFHIFGGILTCPVGDEQTEDMDEEKEANRSKRILLEEEEWDLKISIDTLKKELQKREEQQKVIESLKETLVRLEKAIKEKKEEKSVEQKKLSELKQQLKAQEDQ